jgi:hypothetical protein
MVASLEHGSAHGEPMSEWFLRGLHPHARCLCWAADERSHTLDQGVFGHDRQPAITKTAIES